MIKRSKSTLQQLKILNLCIQRYLKGQHRRVNRNLTKEYIGKVLHQFKKQQERLVESIFKMTDRCGEIMEDRNNHIKALETARNKKIYDCMTEYQTYVLETQGKEDFEKYIQKFKHEIFGEEAVQQLAPDSTNKIPKYLQLKNTTEKWNNLMEEFFTDVDIIFTRERIKQWYCQTLRAKRMLKNIVHTIKLIRQEEWRNAKPHYIRIGKIGNIARMLNPKNRSGPVACSSYPTKPGEPSKKARNDEERVKASILTHNAWMSDPHGKKKCHFIDIIEDSVGPNGVNINTEKVFGDDAQWNYLEDMLKNKVDEETVERISFAHKKLPKLFRQIKTDTKIIYPFKYDCSNGTYIYPELEANLRKNITKSCTCPQNLHRHIHH